MEIIFFIIAGIILFFICGFIFTDFYEKHSEFYQLLLKLEEEMRSDG